jgi:hypothetical protein
MKAVVISGNIFLRSVFNDWPIALVNSIIVFYIVFAINSKIIQSNIHNKNYIVLTFIQ